MPIENVKLPLKIRAAINFKFQGPPKFTQIGIFGLKMWRLATLIHGRAEELSITKILHSYAAHRCK
jgi:hypothetical protein